MTTTQTILLGFISLAVTTFSQSALADNTSAFDKQMAPIAEAYVKIPEALASDSTDGVQDAVGTIINLAPKLNASTVTGVHRHYYLKIPTKLKAAAAEMAKAKNIDAMRSALKGLSKPMALWATLSKPKGIVVGYCSMARGSWLQKGDTIANPYYGAKMLRCGEIVESN